MNQASTRSLRHRLRQSRRQLSARQQRQASIRLYKKINAQRYFRAAKRIAFYLASDGEIDPTLLLNAALRRGQHCYLPCIHPLKSNRMLFIRYRQGDRLVRHRWGMLQPVLRSKALLNTSALDLVFVPLVAFDKRGTRLGMGKGFYDRSFDFRRRMHRHSPQLVGLAHECQRVETLERQPWDVPMDKIVSDHHTYHL